MKGIFYQNEKPLMFVPWNFQVQMLRVLFAVEKLHWGLRKHYLAATLWELLVMKIDIQLASAN